MGEGGGGGGGVERSPIKKSRGVKIKKIIGRGVFQILKNMGRGGGGGGGYLAIFCGHVVLCDLNSGTYQNCAILVRTRIVYYM